MTDIRKRECILQPLEDYAPLCGRETELIDAVTASGLCGRGYAGLPLAERWATFAKRSGEKELICLISGICADTLVAENPGAVWAGLALTARAFGLGSAWVVSDCGCAVPEEFFGVRFKTFAIEHGLSAGEETLIFARIEGRSPITAPQPPYPVEKGLFGHPTLIHSAELFAHLPYLLCGCDRNTKLSYIGGDVERAGIYELTLGTPLTDCAGLAGAESIKAVRLGGVNGRILPAGKSGKFDYGCCRENGIFFGDGSIAVLSERRCIARELYLSLKEAYTASCGRCVFCREGLYQLFLLLEDVVKGKASDGDIALIRDISSVIAENAGCEYGQSTAKAVNEAITDFYDEIEAHTRSKCASLACPGMFTVHILPDKCTGCGKCAACCPSDAISGGEGLIHVVDQAKCDQCGACFVCPADAVVRAGMQKPACPDRPIPVGSFVQKKKGLQRRVK